MQISKTRRIDLDGLRGISVIAVLIYHFKFFEGIPLTFSGFIGVDIFFVLSGYVIASTISQKKFNIIKYFENRFRKIFLPLIITIILTLIVFNSINDILNIELAEDFYKSANSSTFFYSNWYYFIKSKDYFYQLSLSPFIHTWSLSMELQFYLIAPIFLFYLKKFQNFFTISIITISLLVPHLYGSYDRNFPFIDLENLQLNLDFGSKAYFLFPARLWEFFIGVLLFNIYDLKIFKKKKNISNYLVYLGLIIIISSFFLISDMSPMPSIYLLLPIFGTSLVLIFYQSNSQVVFILKNKIIQYLGKISYSLYLVHYPIFILCLNYFYNSFGLILKIISIIFSIFLSHIFYQFIEKKSVGKNRLNLKNFLYLCLITITTFLIINDFIYKRNIEKKLNFRKYNPNLINILQPSKKEYEILKIDRNLKFSNFSAISNTKVLVIGDSHARDLFHSLKIIEKKINHMEFGYLNIEKNFEYENLNKFEIFKKSQYLIFTKRFSELISDEIKQINSLINYSKKFKKKIIIVDNSPQFYSYNITPAKILALRLKNKKNINKETIKDYINNNFIFYKKKENLINQELTKMSRNNDFNLVLNNELRCEMDKNICFGVDENLFELYRDYGHLTDKGMIFFSKKIFNSKWLIKAIE